MAAAVAGFEYQSQRIERTARAHQAHSPTHRHALGIHVQARARDLVGGRTAQDAVGPGSDHRLRELGAHARAARPVIRGSVRGMGPRHRRLVAADASVRLRITVSVDTPLKPVRIDARRLRSARTRQTIIEPYLVLLRYT